MALRLLQRSQSPNEDVREGEGCDATWTGRGHSVSHLFRFFFSRFSHRRLASSPASEEEAVSDAGDRR